MNTNESTPTHAPRRRTIINWLQLLRVSALPTAISNILAGFLISNRSWSPTWELLLLVASSSCLYMSGMVLNDWWDRDVDQTLRPERPIPAGHISPDFAFIAYVILTFAGLAFAAFVSPISFRICICLIVCIALYDCALKQTTIAPLIMGLCRSLNLLLGASSLAVSPIDAPAIFEAPTIMIAISLGIFISGVTWFARDESTGENRGMLTMGMSLMILGIVGFIAAPLIYEIAASRSALLRYIAIVALVGLPITMRASAALRQPQPVKIGKTIGTALRSLILFDAAFAYLFSHCQIAYPVVILLLLIPAVLLSRWVSPT